MAIAAADFIAGMAKGMAVLESFDTERQRLNATLAAQRAGITRAAARRHLLTLAHLGYLESDGAWFWLSPKVLRLSGSYLATARLPRLVQPALDRLAAQTGLPFSVVVRDGDEVVLVARSGPTRLAYGLHLGARLPVHATSTGRMLLACLPRRELAAWLRGRELPRLTLHTVVDAGQLRERIEAARAQDHCLASQEHELGIAAIAVPLRDLRGRCVAALNAVAGADSADRLRAVLPLLHEAAAGLRAMVESR